MNHSALIETLVLYVMAMAISALLGTYPEGFVNSLLMVILYHSITNKKV